jgi:hypothetical protein
VWPRALGTCARAHLRASELKTAFGEFEGDLRELKRPIAEKRTRSEKLLDKIEICDMIRFNS